MRGVLHVCALAFTVACSQSPSSSAPDLPQTPAPSAAIRVLMVTATVGFRHDSIPEARQAVATLATQSRAFTVAATEDVGELTAARLASVDVLMFALTTGELPLGSDQKTAIVDFVTNGGGFIGVHSASDTLYEWPEYGRIVGAYFKEHPWTQQATVSVEDAAHPICSGLGARFTLTEEFYTFRENPRSKVHMLLSLDPASVGAQGDFPLAWTQTIGRGRSYYNALGHFSATWNDSRFRSQIANAIRWAAGRN